MTNLGFELTRRKILAGLGTIGVASAGAGLGTSAYFSDEESFKDNQLVAGELDLMVDWQEHYSDWSDDEHDAAPSARMVDDASDVGEDELGLPIPDEPMLSIAESDINAFMDATATDAFPDRDDDGIQDIIYTRDQIQTNPSIVGLPANASDEEVEGAYRDQFAQVPDDLERPLIDIEDVKPGDFGEVTFSIHLFDNPGYLWMNGRLLANEEVSVTEPEAADPDEDNSTEMNESEYAESIQGEDVYGELVDAIQVAIWQDDGNNLLDAEESLYMPHSAGDGANIGLSAEKALVFRGTLREALSQLSAGAGMPLDGDPTDEDRHCYPNSITRHLAMAWWLPVDHANEIQTDRVAFDLGFYTEQCRHNDGSGMTDAVDLSTGIADWYVTESPDSMTGPAVVTDPHPAWATTQCASWIDPYGNDPETSDPEGDYTYELEFTVEGSSPVDTLVIDTYGSDNPVEFFLDGDSIGSSGSQNAFTSLRSDISPVPDLDPGTHTLRAEVVNNPGGDIGNPTGLLMCAYLE